MTDAKKISKNLGDVLTRVFGIQGPEYFKQMVDAINTKADATTSITDASTSHATSSFGEVNTALDALATKINEVIDALE